MMSRIRTLAQGTALALVFTLAPPVAAQSEAKPEASPPSYDTALWDKLQVGNASLLRSKFTGMICPYSAQFAGVTAKSFTANPSAKPRTANAECVYEVVADKTRVSIRMFATPIDNADFNSVGNNLLEDWVSRRSNLAQGDPKRGVYYLGRPDTQCMGKMYADLQADYKGRIDNPTAYGTSPSIEGLQPETSAQNFFVRALQGYRLEEGQSYPNRSMAMFAALYIDKTFMSVQIDWPDNAPSHQEDMCARLTAALRLNVSEIGRVR